MKTNPIFALLLTLLLCFGANLSTRQCICLPEQEAVSVAHTTAQKILKEVCADCGHTNACCATHNDTPAAVHILAMEITPATANLVRVLFAFTSTGSQSLAESGVNKAPPRCSSLSLVTLHRLLLV